MTTSDVVGSGRPALPLILIRGFGGLGVSDERRIAYQGFNDGTVYPGKRGENYIYEGLILRLLKSDWEYKDATNVIAYYGSERRDQELPLDLVAMQRFFAERLVLDEGVRRSIERTTSRVRNTVWVFRYYDLDDRRFPFYGAALVRLIGFIRDLASDREEEATGEPPKVNIIAHSMGGLIVREAVQVTYPELYGQEMAAADHINKIVTLGTPHQGISFQLLKDWIGPDAQQEIERFNPDFQADESNPASYKRFRRHFPPERLLTVVGTNYRTYGTSVSSLANRLFSVPGEFGPNYNRSDGLVKQAYAQVPGAPRTFVHKCHGGPDSLVTSREAFEVAMRFFFGDRKARLRLLDAEVTRGLDVFGKSEVFFGVSIKPRGVDFDLFHQTADAENCYGPFRSRRLDDDVAFSWAGPDRLIWEGWLDSRARAAVDGRSLDLVMRLDVYVGERDSFGLGFSDNVIFHKQYYVQAVMDGPLQLYLHTGERLLTGTVTEGDREVPVTAELLAQAAERDPDNVQRCVRLEGGWTFEVKGTGFRGRFHMELEQAQPESP
jgi:pimeloyl-ACP methyl ester carboxylesterase